MEHVVKKSEKGKILQQMQKINKLGEKYSDYYSHLLVKDNVATAFTPQFFLQTELNVDDGVYKITTDSKFVYTFKVDIALTSNPTDNIINKFYNSDNLYSLDINSFADIDKKLKKLKLNFIIKNETNHFINEAYIDIILNLENSIDKILYIKGDSIISFLDKNNKIFGAGALIQSNEYNIKFKPFKYEKN
jgi:hypothetical protein